MSYIQNCIGKRTRSQSQVVTKRLKISQVVLPRKPAKVDVHDSAAISRLNDDCWRKVFSYLNPNDLSNVYAASARFRVAAERIFERKYSRTPLVLSNASKQQVMESSLQILKSFGQFITRLIIEFRLENVQHILQAINSCGKKIIQVEFYHLGVEESSTERANGLQNMKSFLCRLNAHFPNLLHLKFNYANTSVNCKKNLPI